MTKELKLSTAISLKPVHQLSHDSHVIGISESSGLLSSPDLLAPQSFGEFSTSMPVVKGQRGVCSWSDKALGNVEVIFKGGPKQSM